MMMKKNLFLAALAIVALASCTDSEFVGDNSPDNTPTANENAIVFNSGAKTVTRADHVGADAASLLHNKFIVGGFKGTYDYSGTPSVEDVTVATGTVFDNYVVEWGANTAGTTTSNTSDWEYVNVNVALPSSLYVSDTSDPNYPVKQTIKYWDYSSTQYDFIAYSTGNATVTTTLSTDADVDDAISRAIGADNVHVTAIDPSNAKTAAYKLSGKAADLAKCYIADMVTIYKDGTDGTHYQDEVQLSFRSLAAKVRMAVYETVPGYSVKDVYFYQDASTAISTDISSNTSATLFTTGSADKDNFYTKGTYTVYFPTIGKSNVSPTKNSDYNKAHASFAVVDGGKETKKAFGTLQLVGKDYREADATNYIGRTAATASFAGTAAPYYEIAMPNEEGTVLELRVDYTLLSIDGSGEEIHVHGATAYVPAIYAAWKSNYAYTYIFKISDNTNGWTSTVTSDPTGLYPITFDAIVVDSEEHTQSTITNVATPSITTYQVGHVNADGTYPDEYDKDKGKIYVQVYWDGATPALRDDLGSKGQLYTLSDATATEAEVLDALNIQMPTTVSGYNITGRNGVSLKEETSTATIVAIPGPDGNNITVSAGTAAEFTPAAGTYAYVYDTDTYAGDYYPAKPADWDTKYNTDYFTNPACTTHPASATFSAGTYYKKTSYIASYNEFTSAPDDWQNDATNPYYSDEACTTQITGAYANPSASYTEQPAGWPTGYYTDTSCETSASTFTSGTTYYQKLKCYRKYTVNNKVYGVKVIKVVD